MYVNKDTQNSPENSKTSFKPIRIRKASWPKNLPNMTYYLLTYMILMMEALVMMLVIVMMLAVRMMMMVKVQTTAGNGRPICPRSPSCR